MMDHASLVASRRKYLIRGSIAAMALAFLATYGVMLDGGPYGILRDLFLAGLGGASYILSRILYCQYKLKALHRKQ